MNPLSFDSYTSKILASEKPLSLQVKAYTQLNGPPDTVSFGIRNWRAKQNITEELKDLAAQKAGLPSGVSKSYMTQLRAACNQTYETLKKARRTRTKDEVLEMTAKNFARKIQAIRRHQAGRYDYHFKVINKVLSPTRFRSSKSTVLSSHAGRMNRRNRRPAAC